ncbi:MAG: HNH endonuclease [Rhodococcus sp.]|nr:HNH endonuclease [Rhodococcus sp. (in: high G+C Gram-positive bacteria)]
MQQQIQATRRWIRPLQWALCAAIVAAYISIDGTRLDPFRAPPAPGSPTRAELSVLLDAVTTVPARPRPGGYERACSHGQACVFGPAWTDINDAAHGRDGCDTRNNALALTLGHVTYQDDTAQCVVLSGTLPDPYSGEVVEFHRSDGSAIHIDHIYPLAAAWDFGASQWPLARRIQFANDVEFNLLAVNRSANMDKGDKTPADWLPPHPSYRCYYAAKYLSVAIEYDLPITVADHDSLADVAERC